MTRSEQQVSHFFVYLFLASPESNIVIPALKIDSKLFIKVMGSFRRLLHWIPLFKPYRR